VSDSNVPTLTRKIEDTFSEEYLSDVAFQTGFCKRRSKFTPMMFFDILLYNASSESNKSLNELTVEAISEHHLAISKQGVDKRFNESSLLFIKTIFEKHLAAQYSHLRIEDGWLSHFKHLRIKDGTRFDVPEDFYKQLPGSGGSASKAGVCIQYEFDVKSGRILDLTVTPANRPDCVDAQETMSDVEAGDLVIRDLGYFVLEPLRNMISKNASIISRLNTKVVVYTQNASGLEELDFAKLYDDTLRNKTDRVEMQVLIGEKALLPIRLIIERVPEAVYEQRMRKVNRTNKKKGRRTSAEHAMRSHFSLFITNVPVAAIPARAISALYHIRWQIELVFKVWKSTFGIHNTRTMKYNRWLCLLYAKLLVVVVNWEIVMQQRSRLYIETGRLLSIDKCMKTMRSKFDKVRKTLKRSGLSIGQVLESITEILSANHWLEKKKGKMNYEEIMYILYSKSNIYVYF
jgi:hypothetical protein